MMKPLPYVARKVSHGRVYWYFRRGEVYFPLPDPDEPGFRPAYDALLAGRVPVKVSDARTWSNLIALHRSSPEWAALSPRTQRDYATVFDWIDRAMGPLDPSTMRTPDVIRVRDAQAFRRRFANYIVQVMVVLFNRARALGWIDGNPARGVKLIERPKGMPDLHQPWPTWAQDAYRAASIEGAPERTAMELAVGVSQRIGDTLALRWADWTGDGIHITQSKTGTALLIPPTEALEQYLDRIPRHGETMVANDAGRAFTYNAFAKRFRAVRERAAARLMLDGDATRAQLMARLTVHGWRYTVAAEMATAGASDSEISAVTGHKTLAMIRKYAGAERQKAMARAGQDRRSKSGQGTALVEGGKTSD